MLIARVQVALIGIILLIGIVKKNAIHSHVALEWEDVLTCTQTLRKNYILVVGQLYEHHPHFTNL